jgi:hypothetical protein
VDPQKTGRAFIESTDKKAKLSRDIDAFRPSLSGMFAK